MPIQLSAGVIVPPVHGSARSALISRTSLRYYHVIDQMTIFSLTNTYQYNTILTYNTNNEHVDCAKLFSL